MFGLRKVNGNTHSFETTFQNWKEKGEDVALLMPEFSAKWLPIAEESGSWSGWVDFHDDAVGLRAGQGA